MPIMDVFRYRINSVILDAYLFCSLYTYTRLHTVQVNHVFLLHLLTQRIKSHISKKKEKKEELFLLI